MHNNYLYIILIFLTFSVQGQALNRDSLLQQLDRLESDSAKTDTYNKIAHSYGLDESRQCLLYLNKAIELGEKIEFWLAVGQAYNFKATIYQMYADNTKALQLYFKAQDCFQKINDPKQVSDVISNIAGVYFGTGQDSMAMIYINQAIDLKKELKDQYNLGLSLTGKAMLLERMQKNEAAIAMYKEAETIFQSLKDTNSLTILYSNWGGTYQSMGDLDKGEAYCKKCYELATKVQFRHSIAQALFCLIEITLHKQQYNEAKTYLDNLLTVVESMRDIPKWQKTTQLATQYYAAVNDYENAYYYSLKNKNYSDSLDLQQKESEKQRLSMIRELHEKEVETAQLSTKQAQQESIIAQQRIIFIIAIVAFLIIVTLFIHQIRMNRTMQAKNQQLEKQQVEISNKKQELETLNASKDQLFSIISHDLIAPLHVLNGILTLQKEDALPKEELPQFLDMAIHEVNNTTIFLRNLLYWAKSQMDGITANPEEFDFEELIQQQIELQQGAARNKQLNLSSKITSSAYVYADRDLMSTVVRNLLMNAIKFTPEGGDIHISAQEQDSMLQVAICDTGVGIPFSEQSKVLTQELYSTRGTNNEKGTGLGLKLCQDFVTKSGGRLWFDSSPDQGTTFYFTIPLAAARAAKN